MKTLCAVTACVALLAACSSGHPKSTPSNASGISFVGIVNLKDSTGRQIADGPSGGCQGSGPFADLVSGTKVAVSDDTGKTLTAVNLNTGTLKSGTLCQFTFYGTVPAGMKFYGIAVGSRGVEKFAEADIKTPTLTFGG